MSKIKMKQIGMIIAVVVLVVALAACSGTGSGGTAGSGSGSTSGTNTGTSGSDAADGGESWDGTIKVSLGGEPNSLDPALISDTGVGSVVVHLFSGLAKWTVDDKGIYSVVPDLATELPEGVKNDNGTVTYTYTIRQGAKWSDGKDVTPQDFIYAWQRASKQSTGGPYYYLFDAIDGYSESNPDSVLNMGVSEEGNLVVVLASDCAYWNELLAFPTFFPVREDVASNPEWAENQLNIISNGPYRLTSWDHNANIILEKNDKYPDATAITAEKIEFYLTDQVNDMLNKFEDNSLQFIGDVPTNMVTKLQESYPDEFFIKGALSTYFLNWNVNTDLVGTKFEGSQEERAIANAEVRRALNTIIDRDYIVREIGQAGQVPASSLVAMGITEPDGSQFYANANKAVGNSYYGYFDPSPEALEGNVAAAIEVLKKYYDYDEATGRFTDAPILEYLYNTSEGHKAIAEEVQYNFSDMGLVLNASNLEHEQFLQARKEGSYILARNSWFADYNDPICFLGMWTTASGYNDAQLGRGNHGELGCYNLDLTDLGYEENITSGTWAATYDMLIAKIKAEPDATKRYALMHKAEDLLMSTGCICPVYYYTDVYMLDSSVKGFYASPLGYKYFMHTTVE